MQIVPLDPHNSYTYPCLCVETCECQIHYCWRRKLREALFQGHFTAVKKQFLLLFFSKSGPIDFRTELPQEACYEATPLFCYNLHWFKMKPKCTELTKYIDLRKLNWDGDLQSSTSMVQFLLQKGAVYHLYCSEKFSKKTRERNSSRLKATTQDSRETITLLSKSRSDSHVRNTINQAHGSYSYSPHLKRRKLSLPPQRCQHHAQSSSDGVNFLSSLPVSPSLPVSMSLPVSPPLPVSPSLPVWPSLSVEPPSQVHTKHFVL